MGTPVRPPRRVYCQGHRVSGQPKRTTARTRMKTVFGWLTSSVLRLARMGGAIAGGDTLRHRADTLPY